MPATPDHKLPPLCISAIVDRGDQPRWALALLEAIENHPRLRLVSLHDAPAASGQDSTGALPATSPPMSGGPVSAALASAGRLIVHRLIDKPRFTDDPLQRQPATTALQQKSALSGRALPDEVQVVLLLSASVTDLTAFDHGGVRLWSAGLPSLSSRVESSLLERADLLWIHLWESQGESQDESQADSTRVLATHALPIQSFSITDMTHAAFHTLPALFLSRLNWLAHGLDPMAMQDGYVDQASVARQDDDHNVPGVLASSMVQERTRTREYGDVLAAAQATTENGTTLLARACRLLYLQLRKRLNARFVDDQWQLAWAGETSTHEPSIETLLARPLDSYRSLKPPTGTLWADPHVLVNAGCTHVFFESMRLGDPAAHIATAELHTDGSVHKLRTALELDCHLSYPFVFHHEGNHYMIPETASRETVSLFRSTRFPHQWTHECDLLSNINAADTTVYHHAEHWYLFTNLLSHPTVDERDELHLFVADSVHGPWRAHPLNPVATGVDRARMAGPVFSVDGVLYRPGQYGARRYGYGINLSAIITLTPEHYREVPMGRILPREGSHWLGCHSMTQSGGLTLIDRVASGRRGS